MKLSLSALSLGLAAALVAFPIDTLISRQLTHQDGTIAVAQEQQALDLNLVGHKREVRTNRQGLPEVTAILNSNGIIRYKTLFQMSDETEEITARKDFSRFTRWWLADMNGEVKKN